MPGGFGGQSRDGVRWMETPGADAGKEWSEMDIIDLRQCIKTGDCAEETAQFLRRSIGEVREKVAELGLSFCRR